MTTTPKQSGFVAVRAEIDLRFTSGNLHPVTQARIKADEWQVIIATLAAAEAMREALVKIGDLQGSQRSDAEVCRAANRIATSAVHAFDRLKEK